ncbi:helix-turn-helix domain-containing protein, partial [Frankia sp. CcWB2]
AACATRDFRAVFRLMKKYDGASQNRIASPVEGLSQSRVSRIMQGEDRIARLSLIERIADALRIPGSYFHLAARPWEAARDVREPPGPPTVPAGPGPTPVAHVATPSVDPAPAPGPSSPRARAGSPPDRGAWSSRRTGPNSATTTTTACTSPTSEDVFSTPAANRSPVSDADIG